LFVSEDLEIKERVEPRTFMNFYVIGIREIGEVSLKSEFFIAIYFFTDL